MVKCFAKLLSAIDVIFAADTVGKSGLGKLAGRLERPERLECLIRWLAERGEVRYSLRKASKPARPSGGGSLRSESAEGGVAELIGGVARPEPLLLSLGAWSEL